MAPRLAIANVGVPPDHPSIPQHLQPQIKSGLELVSSQMAANDFAHRFIYVTPDISNEELKEELTSSHLDGIVIGNGVRGNMAMTPLFERLVIAIREHAPQAKIMFNTCPTDSIEAVMRNFPTGK